ncbi:cell cycle control protein 50A-like [Corticium candelabrum]|uniref:cell cycle control protein 50A-like n=1 Tax=Corticium candelabrum TaxID=121492 RepID=UPI002E26CDAB|nr:cell cycle control protein 50A-like [Corticium candelabrum]
MKGETGDRKKSRKPSSAAWKQQKCPACKPVWSAKLLSLVFFATGVLFIIIGVPLYVAVSEVDETTIDYTNCKPTVPEDFANYTNCADFLEQTATFKHLPEREGKECICEVKFNVSDDFKPTVYMYYRLTNFYQNHRRYVKSRDDNQLAGDPTATIGVCSPFQEGRLNNSDDELPYAPCGMIANSLFNDTLLLSYYDRSTGDSGNVNVTRTGIAWTSDRDDKFKNPSASTVDELCTKFDGTLHPPSWNRNACRLTDDLSNTGFVNEDLIVWMRTAAFPTFRKLYGKVDGLQMTREYTLRINYRYPVSAFDGEKAVVFGQSSVVGGRNFFLPIAYIVVGSILIAMACGFLAIHMFVEKQRDAGYLKRIGEFKQ